MITLLFGENSYETEQALGRIVASFDGEPEKFDGAELEFRQLPDLLTGQSLFAEKRLVIIRGLSANKQLWDAMSDLLKRMSDDIHLVFVEAAPDKRTMTYKALQKVADVKEFQSWGERDRHQAERWAIEEAKRMNVQLDSAAARALLDRSFIQSAKGQSVVDQWQAKHALEKLSVFDAVTPEVVEKYIDEHPIDSVFNVFETALRGDRTVLHRLIKDLEPREDPFKVFGLLSSQVFQLAALVLSDAPTPDVAKVIGAHPYALSKLSSHAKRLRKTEIKQIVQALTEADEDLKLSKASPWTLIEQALTKVALVTKPN